MTIIPEGRLTVNVARHGGQLGRTVRSQVEVGPRSPAHTAAVALLGLDPPDRSPGLRRDAFTYDVEIIDESGDPLLRARFHDPIPDELDTLLTALDAPKWGQDRPL